ncbi:MAG: zinc-binding dehydrogenase [Dehalococcoidia bacterium]|nr:zinc-binding dehydrogenase [Dehalococcoidia bacterium]
MQLAEYDGAEVTAVVATRHVELARSLGADHVIDYTAEDFTRIGKTFDFVFDAVGKTSYFECRRLLAPAGVIGDGPGPWASNSLRFGLRITRRKRVLFALPANRKPFVAFLRDRMEAGDFRGVIDRSYPLERIQEAYAYVLSEQKVGIVVLDLAPTAMGGSRPDGDAGGRPRELIQHVGRRAVSRPLPGAGLCPRIAGRACACSSTLTLRPLPVGEGFSIGEMTGCESRGAWAALPVPVPRSS